MRRFGVWVRHHVLLGLHGFLLFRKWGIQLLSDQHGDGGLVEGRQFLVLRRPSLLHGLQRNLQLHHRLWERFQFL